MIWGSVFCKKVDLFSAQGALCTVSVFFILHFTYFGECVRTQRLRACILYFFSAEDCQAAESWPACDMFCFCFLFTYLFLTIPVRPVIAKSTGPIFAKF